MTNARSGRRFGRRCLYVAFIWMVLFAGWEYDQSQVTLASGSIPEQSIRLRILAHSDAPYDQWLKNRVRNAVVEDVNRWAPSGTGDIQAARREIRARLDDLDRLVGDVLRRHGSDYTYKVELGPTPFPAKMYGNRVYPAGEYEALRITIGEGRGRNWWCVLFPPLCFVDAASGEAVAASDLEGEGTGDEADDMREKRPMKRKCVSFCRNCGTE